MKIGIIGGSGLDDPQILDDKKEIDVTTLYGKPSSLTIGKIGGIDVVLIARHGKGHSIMPGNVNFRANICAMKEQGVTHIIATTACGSLREEIKPGNLVFIDQFVDKTKARKSTFFDKDKVCHISMSEPFCKKLRNLLIHTANELGITAHEKGTMVTIEGPRFSTKAESNMFRMLGCDVINMSTVPEVVLAREAGICYASIAMSTDYDCWKEEPVTWEMISSTMKKNSENVIKILLNVIRKIDYQDCECRESLKNALV